MAKVKSAGLWAEAMSGCSTQGQDTKTNFTERKSMAVEADVPFLEFQ